MQIHLFGCTNPVGNSFYSMAKENYQVQRYSRSFIKEAEENLIEFDLLKPRNFNFLNFSDENYIISFAPIWDLANFLSFLDNNKKDSFKKIRGIICCSSSSVITKRFSFNEYDKRLVKKLISSEICIESICRDNNISACIFRPTLIYGSSGKYKDKNLSKIIDIMTKLPFIFLPRKTGLRQPIHASQLSKVVLFQLKRFIENPLINEVQKIEIGGDCELSYFEMIKKIKSKLGKDHPASNCKLINLPEYLFFFLLSPLIFFRPTLYEAILRINANLSGFKKSYLFANVDYEDFPIIKLKNQFYKNEFGK